MKCLKIVHTVSTTLSNSASRVKVSVSRFRAHGIKHVLSGISMGLKDTYFGGDVVKTLKVFYHVTDNVNTCCELMMGIFMI